MSYNIDSWKLKEIRDFRISTAALRPIEDYLDSPRLNTETGVLSFQGRSGGFELCGRQEGDVLIVESIKNRGEASGTMQEFLNEKVFPHSSGLLHAVLVWEGGDGITRLTVKDGVVKEEEVEL